MTKKTTSDLIKDAAASDTTEGALSMAAQTEPAYASPASATPASESIRSLEMRLASLEATIAFLFATYNWPAPPPHNPVAPE